MKKIETIWHYLLVEALENKNYRHTQQELANFFGYSLSTVNYALKEPAQIGAVRKESKFFVLENFNKLLYFWASQRALSKDLLYKTYFAEAITEIEKMIPAESIYACYSAARKILGEAAADYSKVYFYFDEKKIGEVKLRFPEITNKEPNVFVLRVNQAIKKSGQITTLPQTFVDIWNLKDWYGQDFTRALERKINEKLSS